MVLAIADSAVVAAARDYAYQLWELKSMLDRPPTSVMKFTTKNFEAVDKAIRLARHGMIDAIRVELKVGGSARPDETKGKYNPFRDDTKLGPKYAARKRDRPGSAV